MARERGFTLVEILIVVLILGILGAVVLPRFSNATAIARASMLADSLRIFRTQIMVFKGQHRGVAPSYLNGDTSADPTEAAFIAHMTQASNDSCQTAPPNTAGFRRGPYLREIPVNPVNDKSSVQIIVAAEPMPDAGDDSHGWIYQPSTLTFKADCPGADEAGKAFINY